MARFRSLIVLAGAWLLLPACNSPKSGPATSGGSSAPSPSKTIISKSGVSMVSIPGGSFKMGSDHDSPEEAPAHTVTVSAFDMDEYPVTHDMFTKAQLPDPSHWQENPKTPVERIRWRNAKEYCNERSRMEGLSPCYNEKTSDWVCDYAASGYRLPTEAEWEYAAKAGVDGPYDFGPPTSLSQYSWYADNADKKTHPVGQKKPNAFGLYDMYGNVSVWCEDVYDPAYYKTSPAKDPHGPASTSKDVKRVLRGGNWKATAEMCRATFRQGERTGDTDACFATDYCGMRCVRNHIDQAIAATTPSTK